MPRLRTRQAKPWFIDRIIPKLKDFIRQGYPWNRDNIDLGNTGMLELRGLATGHFFLTRLFKEKGDEELKEQLYEAIRDDFVAAQAHYRPGTRPWAWWKWDAPEPRRIVGRVCLDPSHDDDCEGGCIDGEGRLPAAEDPDLPEWAKGKMYFGAPSVFDGYAYEDEYDYLERLDFLFPEERVIFEKYGELVNVHVAQGERGKCAPCWERARKIAKRIDFDLDSGYSAATSFGYPVIFISRASMRSRITGMRAFWWTQIESNCHELRLPKQTPVASKLRLIEVCKL